MSKYTPGPWKKYKAPEKNSFYIKETNMAIIATVHQCCRWEDGNARLIAAAPQMMDVLKTVAVAFRDNAPHLERVSALMDVGRILSKIEGDK